LHFPVLAIIADSKKKNKEYGPSRKKIIPKYMARPIGIGKSQNASDKKTTQQSIKWNKYLEIVVHTIQY
jgi:hypothetical protein